MTPTYQQPIKNDARRFALKQAIAALTTERADAAVVREDEFNETLEYSLSLLEQLKLVPASFRLEAIRHAEEWHAFHRSVVGNKKPSELRVLYLSGPEPQNDLYILLEEGIIPQNIWAVESQGTIYDSAVEQLKNNGLYIRIHHGSLEAFFDSTNEQFDIIYIDACGPFPSTHQNALRSCVSMFHRERLASIGVLITNFAHPPKEKKSHYERLLCYYFAPRHRDFPHELYVAGADPAMAEGQPDYLRPFIVENFDACYSEFITRFLTDIGREIIPYARIYDNKDNRVKYFASGDDFKAALNRATRQPSDIHDLLVGNIAVTSIYPVLSFINYASRDKALDSLMMPITSSKLQNENIKSAFQNTVLLSQVLEGHWDIASEQILLALRESWLDSHGGLFCDVPLPILLINSLIGIYGHPYFPNPRQSSRFSYVAKETKMYMDCTLFDQCRYYFDYLPTIDLIPERFKSFAYQLVLRSCLDRIGRHDFESSSHPFPGASLGCFDDFASADAYDFAARADAPPGA